MREIIYFLALSFFSLLFLGCPKKEPELATSNLPKYKFAVAEAVISKSAVCPVCLRAVFTCETKSGAASEFYEALAFALKENDFEMNRLSLSGIEAEKKKEPESWLTLAKALKADYLILPVIYCWSERKGTEISASAPAEVGFHLHIYQVESGKEVWGGDFNERQIALSENLLALNDFIKRGGKWVKAEDLGKEGAEKLIKQFLKSIQEK
jgi:hypothetical protein